MRRAHAKGDPTARRRIQPRTTSRPQHPPAPRHRLPKGIGNIRAIAAEHADAEGVDLQQAIWQVVKSLFKAASKEDVAAARLLLDRLPESGEIAGDSIVQIVTGVPRAEADKAIEELF